MKDPEEKEMMAYVAGLIDGDGSIGITRIKSEYRPYIQFHNSMKHICVYLLKLFGGTVVLDNPKKENERPIWRWILQGKEGCVNFLNKVSAFLIMKKDSADVLFEFLINPVSGLDYHRTCAGLNLKRKVESHDFNCIHGVTSDCSYFWAYAAGIMDTDGSFSIERSVRKPGENRQKKDLIKYRPKILLTMVCDRSIKHILSNCKYGGLSIVKANSALRGSAFRLSIQARSDAIEFLKRCVPYLQVKAIQAVKLLSFCRSYNPTNGLAKVPEDEKEYREKCYKEMIMLNNTPS